MTTASTVLLRTQSDARLLALARDGHERAFEAIVERYRRQLMRTCRRVLPEARAEDALQQALLAAWTAVRRGDEVRELRPWLHRIAHRTALNQLRMSGYDFDELHGSLRVGGGPDEELERRAVMRETLAGLAALPDRQREALLAIAVEGRSQDEVAHDLGLSSGAVRQLVHRARSSLRAAATAITPLPLVTWAAAAATRGEPLTSRIAELTAGAGGAGAATALAKAGTVAVLAGSAAAGPAVVERATTHRHLSKAQHATKAEAHAAAPRATPSPRPAATSPRPRLAAPAPAPAPVRRVVYRPRHVATPQVRPVVRRDHDDGETRPELEATPSPTPEPETQTGSDDQPSPSSEGSDSSQMGTATDDLAERRDGSGISGGDMESSGRDGGSGEPSGGGTSGSDSPDGDS